MLDKTQALGCHFDVGGFGGFYTEGLISLFDLTTGVEMWHYGWFNSTSVVDSFGLGLGGSDWGGFPANTLDLNAEIDFLAAHQYELTISAGSNSATDGQRVSIQVTGLAVPEPSALALFIASLLVFLPCRVRSPR